MDLKLSRADIAKVIMDGEEPPDGLVTEAVIVYCYEGIEDNITVYGYGIVKMSDMPDHHVAGLLNHVLNLELDE